MLPSLVLVRHGRATGQAPEATLTPEGRAGISKLAARMAAAGLVPGVALVSLYRRAGETMALLLERLAPALVPEVLDTLAPEADAGTALREMLARLPGPDGRVLVVAHMPLLSVVVKKLTGELGEFRPGTMWAFELDAGRASGVMKRMEADEPAG